MVRVGGSVWVIGSGFSVVLSVVRSNQFEQVLMVVVEVAHVESTIIGPPTMLLPHLLGASRKSSEIVFPTRPEPVFDVITKKSGQIRGQRGPIALPVLQVAVDVHVAPLHTFDRTANARAWHDHASQGLIRARMLPSSCRENQRRHVKSKS